MQVVDIPAFSVMLTARSIPEFWSKISNIQGYFEPSEGNFIMQVIDIRALSVLLGSARLSRR